MHKDIQPQITLPPVTAEDFLRQGIDILAERGKTYDTAQKAERSMGKTVKAFALITGKELTEAEGWTFMSVLKKVRAFQNPAYHQDSWQDDVNYAALGAEAAARHGKAGDRLAESYNLNPVVASAYEIVAKDSGLKLSSADTKAWAAYQRNQISKGLDFLPWELLDQGERNYWRSEAEASIRASDRPNIHY